MPSGNYITNIDADAKADCPIGRYVAIMGRNLLLHLHGTTDPRSVNAVKHEEQRVASCIDDPAAMLVDGWVDQVLAESPEPFERPYIIQTDQAAVTNHVGMEDGDQLPPIWWSFDRA